MGNQTLTFWELVRRLADYALVKKGQAFVWAANLLHGGSPQRDKSRTRTSQVTHYFFEGCKYYTPAMSEPDNIYWRNPEWNV